MKYDDASWHYGGTFPADLSPEAGGTHIGMFVAWCLLNGMAGKIHTEDFPEMLVRLKNRELTPGAWFLGACDEKFTDEDLSEEGNAFAQNYYEGEFAGYLDDYTDAVGKGFPTLYHVPDTWGTFDSLSKVIRRRYELWKKSAR